MHWIDGANKDIHALEGPWDGQGQMKKLTFVLGLQEINNISNVINRSYRVWNIVTMSKRMM